MSEEPDFENMPIEQVNEYLRQQGYDPEQVGLRGKILTDALIKNITLSERVTALEALLAQARDVIEQDLIVARAKYGDSYDCPLCGRFDNPEYCAVHDEMMVLTSLVDQIRGEVKE